jgi:putative FmdB family regulatory protein
VRHAHSARVKNRVPTYDYECRNCGHRVEVLHGVNAYGPTACEQCGGAMRKLISPPTIVFKGTGWAKKDARTAARSAGKTDAASEQTSTSETATKGELGSKGESASKGAEPAAKAESSTESGKTKGSSTAAPAD